MRLLLSSRDRIVCDYARLAAISVILGFFVPAAAADIETDVCVYGGTSGGVVAAVQSARMGVRVVLLEPGRHLGGMTSGGLSAVDIGDPRSIGGIAREYFTRLVASYGKKLRWDQPFAGKGGPATGGAYSIEPHVAERVFDDMAAEARVVVLREARLKSVRKEGVRITALQTDDGRTIQAKMFIDATYEGDLMAAAGVSYTLIREANAQYGEQYNGIHYTPKYQPRAGHQQPAANGRVPGGQGVWDRDFPLDPYVIKGDPNSGLLPLINAGDPGQQGEAAPGVMAYCFRLCLTTEEANRIPIAPPPDYDPKRYELVARFIEACLGNGDDMDLRWFSKHDPLPHAKWDFNTATFGGNLPGASWEWPEASYDRREVIAKEIENYHRGLLHFLATDDRVPMRVRDEMKRFGLAKDEFRDNGGWPHQLYVREGRRMVSDLVITEHHTFGRVIAADSIGLGSYGTDVHEIRRIVKDGVVTREGKVAGGRGGFGPYQIGYGAIVPKQSECENLLVTFALSASHTALASIRMEPVLMVTSQSAATAACLAIAEDVAVQQVDYNKLRARLVADGQILAWPPTGVDANRHQITPPPEPVNTETNVVFILIDDLGWRDLGCYGSAYYQTPHIDQLAHQGMRFTDGYAACNVCSPTRAAIMSGKYPARLLLTQWLPSGRWNPEKNLLREGRYLSNLPLEEVTIAEAMRDAGYRTAFMGKWHLGTETYYYPEHQGFDVNVAGRDYGAPGSYFYPFEGSWDIPTTGKKLRKDSPLPGKDGDYLVDRLAEEAERFIRESADKPFFLMLSHYAVHAPLQGKPDKVARYEQVAKADRQGHPHYAAMVESVDDSVGRVMNTLRELNLDDNTLVIFTSDNGGFAKATDNSPLRANKGSNYEGGIRVPVIVKWPGRTKPGSISHQPVISTDFYPTILAVTGNQMRPHQHLDGVSLVPILDNSGSLKRDAIYWHYPHYNQHPQSFPCGVIRAGDWKLIEEFESGELSLYDLASDVGETTNLALAEPAKTAELLAKLRAWRDDVGADLMKPNPQYAAPPP